MLRAAQQSAKKTTPGSFFTDSQWCELEAEMNKLFQDAVEKVPTG